jgi:hypothetical protein
MPSWAWARSFECSPNPALLASGAGARPDHPNSRRRKGLTKIGAKVVSQARYVAFQMAAVTIPRDLFADILRMIAELRPPPLASTVGIESRPSRV